MDRSLMWLRHNRIVLTLIVLSALAALGVPHAPAQNAGSPERPSAQAAGGGLQIYLPLVLKRGTSTPLQFSSSIDSFGAPIDPATTFSYGITKLYASTVVSNGQQFYANMLFIRPSGGGTQNGKFLSNAQERVTVSISGTGGAPLDRGTYTIRFSLDGAVVQQGTVVIQ